MQPDDDVRLRHMLDAAREALSFIKDKDQTRFNGDRQAILACLHCVQIIGEAAGKLTPACREKIPLPWHQITGMRHRLVHNYYEVDLQRVWDTLHLDLPPLIAVLEADMRRR